jgi:hypothetical protein
MLLFPAGTSRSIDRWLLGGHGILARVVRVIYGLVGMPNTARSLVIRFNAFSAFALLALGAAIFHLDEPAWRTGMVNAYVLTNAYFGRFPFVFRALPPEILVAASVLTIAPQMVWETAMLPLALLSRRTWAFVWWFGIAFFVSSWLLLRLQWLPCHELLLWLFIGRRRQRTERALPTCRSFLVRTFVRICVLADLVFVVFLPFAQVPPVVSWLRGKAPFRVIRPFTPLLGLERASVFNQRDLRLASQYATVTRIDKNGERTLLPFIGLDGSRLSWHASDTVLYSISLPWRVERIQGGDRCWSGAIDEPYVEKVVALDAASGGRAAVYQIDFYETPMGDPLAGNSRGGQKHICTVMYTPRRTL